MALRHSGQMSSRAWRAIQGDLRGVQVDGVRCPDDPSAAFPLLLWWAALDGDSLSSVAQASQKRFVGECFGGDVVWPSATVGGMPSVVRLVDAKVEMAFEKWPSTSLCAATADVI